MSGKSTVMESELLAIAKRFVCLSAEKRVVFEEALIAKGLDIWSLPIVSRPRVHEYFSLSFAQERLWIVEELDSGSARYNLFFGIRFLGQLNLQALERSVNEIIRRHEVLRTNVVNVDGRGQQLMRPFSPFDLPVTDLRLCDPATREQMLMDIAGTEALTPFDLSSESIVRIRVVHCEETEHVLMLTIHHIAFDAWSVGLMTDELSRLYEAFTHERSSPLIDLPIQYADFACWQREWLNSKECEIQLTYWKEQLQSAPASVTLPRDRTPLPFRTFDGGVEILTLSETLSNRIYALCRRSGVTVYMLMLAVYQLLISRYSGEEDICVGTSVANRSRPETERLIGFLVNTLVMRTSLNGDPYFLDLLKRVQGVVAGALAHQDLPFEKLVDVLGVQRDLHTNPLFQAFFVLENVPEKDLRVEHVTLKPFEYENRLVHFDLTLRVSEDNETGRLTCQLEYARELFDTATATQLLKHYHMLLEGAVACPEARLSELSLLSDEEHQHVLVDWNDTQVTYPQDRCIHELFELQATKNPGAPAIRFEGEVLSYQELERRANQLAHYLAGLGVGSEVRVGLCFERSLDLLVGLLAVLKAGGAYVPLDPKLPQSRMSYMLSNSEARLVLTQMPWNDVLTEMGMVCVCLDRDWPEISAMPEEPLACNVRPDNLAYVLYTSGTTGKPKGVAVEHRQLVQYTSGVLDRLSLEDDASFATISTVGADLGNTSIFGALCSGRMLHVLATDRGFDPDAMAEYMHTHRVGVLKITPTHLLGLLEAANPEHVLPEQCLILGGEPVRMELINTVRSLSSDCVLVNHYGPTETTVGVLTHQVENVTGDEAPVPLGRPLSNVQAYILDKDFQPVPIGLPGELYIAGSSLARGYLQWPALTAERFLPNPFNRESGGRVYKTGDRARYAADGTIEFLGRGDNQVKFRGFRVELEEIECHLRNEAEINNAVVVVRKHADRTSQLIAYIVASPELEITALRARLGQALPEYMIPSTIMVLQSLPLTLNGKVDRMALPDLDTEGVNDNRDRCVAPRNEVETRLAEIWAEVLNVEPISMYDNFFDLGGDSIVSLQVIARARKREIMLTPKQLFECPTIAELAVLATVDNTASRLVLQKVDRTEPLLLSYAQQRLWFLWQMDPENAAYNIFNAIRLLGALRIQALQQTLDMIVRRHETLRTTFHEENGHVFQVIHEAEPVKIIVKDLSGFIASEREERVLALAEEEERVPFDLEHGPLLRVVIVRLAETEHVLMMTMHHIVSDGWSMNILVDEFVRSYETFSHGAEATLPALTIQYADYAQWQRGWLESGELGRQLEYWKGRLSQLPPMLELPTDRVRPAVQQFEGATYEFEIDEDLARKIKVLTKESNVTPFMFMLTAFNLLLFRYTGKTDILVGVPIANRGQTETEGLIGCFVNTLVHRTDLSDNPRFQELLQRVKTVVLEAQEHQDLPFERLVEVINPQRNLSHHPLFQVMYNHQWRKHEALHELTNLRIEGLANESHITPFDLILNTEESAGHVFMSVTYSTNLFDQPTIERLARHWRTLLKGIVKNPNERIESLSLLDETEYGHVVSEWDQTSWDDLSDRCLHELIEEQVELYPENVAVTCNGQSLTYAELNVQANRLARKLVKLGVGSDRLVALCVERSLDAVVALLGVLKAGGAYVPIDPDSPSERIAYMLADSQAAVLLTRRALIQGLSPCHTPVIYLDDEEEEVMPSDVEQESTIKSTTSDTLAYVIYTSGSTGRSKGVMVSHRSAVSFLLSMQRQLAPTERDNLLAVTSLSFDIAVLELFLPLMVGAKVTLADRDTVHDGTRLIELLDSSEASFMQATPATWRILLDAGWGGMSGLKVLCGGEAMSMDLAAQMLKLGVRLWNVYGPTETTVWSTIHPVQHATGPICIGRPIANTAIYILDASLHPVPVGVPGELYIGGLGLARGYWNRQILTAEHFIPNPFGNMSGTRLYRTGDIGRWLSDGTIECLGRIDHQVKIRGYRIEPGEIEARLVEHPGIREAVVLAREDQPGDKRLVAYVVSGGPSPNVGEVRAFLQPTLPEYMIPSSVIFLQAMPLNTNGKIDRHALLLSETIKIVDHHVAPRTAVEEILAGIWIEILGVKTVGVRDDFFELGGHSLLATQVMSRLRTAFQVELPLRSLFDFPTVENLARAVERISSRESESAPPSLVPIERKEQMPLSFAQQRLWFLSQLKPDGWDYNLLFALRFVGTLDVPALVKSVQAVVCRHETLRTTFKSVDGEPMQSIAMEEAVVLPVENLNDVAAAEHNEAVHRLATEEMQRPFRLAQEVPIRLRLVRLEQQEHVLLIVLHHIVADAWSMALLAHEVALFYSSFVHGDDSSDTSLTQLPVLPIQYADFAYWQRQWLQGDVLEAQLSYWKQQLGSNPPILRLPTDRPHLSVPTNRGAGFSFSVSQSVTEKIQTLGRQNGVTLFMLLLAAFNVLLFRTTGQEDIIVGTDVANRNREEIEGLIGFFVNLLPLRTDLSGNPTFTDLLQRVRDVTLEAYAHQDVPFEKMVESLRLNRDLGNNPLVQTLCVLQNAPEPSLELHGLEVHALDLEPAVSRFDLGLFMDETDQGLSGVWKYRLDLFDESTIIRLSNSFLTLLESIAENPGTQIRNLNTLSDEERESQIMERKHRDVVKHKKFKSIKPKIVNIRQRTLVDQSYFSPNNSLPLVLQPAVEDVDLVSWAKDNQLLLEKELLAHGAILFRGFTIKKIEEFEQVVQAVCPNLFSEYGDLPREKAGRHIYGTTPYPADKAILFHNESSHMHRWPLKQSFFCIQAAQEGGDTPIVDCREVYKELRPETRDRFRTQSLRYVRNFTPGVDVSWKDFFRTNEKAVVEETCKMNGVEYTWLKDGGLQTSQVSPAITKHPKTREWVFFNQVQLHHVSYLESTVRESLLALLGMERLPRNVYYGDGSPIEDAVVQEVSDVYARTAVRFSWQEGDLLLLDNMLVAHARDPYIGPRKIVVAMGDMVYQETPQMADV